MEIKLEKLNKSYSVLTDSHKVLGSFQLDVDGFWYFWEDSQLSGCWGGWELRRIADLLDEVNKEFDDELDVYFDSLRRDMEEQARVEYRKVLNQTGFFFEWYPQLTGNWKKDKLEWFDIYKQLVDLRAQKESF